MTEHTCASLSVVELDEEVIGTAVESGVKVREAICAAEESRSYTGWDRGACCWIACIDLGEGGGSTVLSTNWDNCLHSHHRM